MSTNIVILHGWALSMNKGWTEFEHQLREKGYKTYKPKIPGLTGRSPKTAWTLEDYAGWLDEYIQKQKLGSFILLGHSFGGSLALAYTLWQEKKPTALILINSAGVRRLSFRTKIISTISTFLKAFLIIYPVCYLRDKSRKLFYRLIKSDYGELDGVMQKTFQMIVKRDLSSEIDKINIPVFMLWGDKDQYTPLDQGLFMNSMIKNSKLVIVNNTGHNLPFVKTKKTITEIDKFIKSL